MPRSDARGFRESIQTLVDERPELVLDALTSAVDATKQYRRDMTCPKCKHKYRAQIVVADDRTRLAAAQLLAEFGSGRPAVAQPETADDEKVRFVHVTVNPAASPWTAEQLEWAERKVQLILDGIESKFGADNPGGQPQQRDGAWLRTELEKFRADLADIVGEHAAQAERWTRTLASLPDEGRQMLEVADLGTQRSEIAA